MLFSAPQRYRMIETMGSCPFTSIDYFHTWQPITGEQASPRRARNIEAENLRHARNDGAGQKGQLKRPEPRRRWWRLSWSSSTNNLDEQRSAKP